MPLLADIIAAKAVLPEELVKSVANVVCTDTSKRTTRLKIEECLTGTNLHLFAGYAWTNQIDIKEPIKGYGTGYTVKFLPIGSCVAAELKSVRNKLLHTRLPLVTVGVSPLQRFEDKTYALLNELKQVVVGSLKDTGDTFESCQKVGVLNAIKALESTLSGVTAEDIGGCDAS